MSLSPRVATPTLALFGHPPVADTPANILAAARALSSHLARSRPLDRRLVASVMTTAFGASDAEGGWLWRDANDAIEAATVLQIRRRRPRSGVWKTRRPRSAPFWPLSRRWA